MPASGPVSVASRQEPPAASCVLVVSAHAGDFVWRAGGAIAAATMRGERPRSSASRTASAASPRASGCRARASTRSRPSDATRRRPRHPLSVPRSSSSTPGDYPLIESPETVAKLVDVFRRVQPTVVLTHPLADPYNGDHPAAARMALQARVLAQAIGVANSDGSFPSDGRDHRRAAGVLLRAAPARAVRLQAQRAARHHGRVPAEAEGDGVPARAEAHVGVLHRPRRAPGRAGQAQRRRRTSACRVDTMGEAYMRYYPQVTDVLQ